MYKTKLCYNELQMNDFLNNIPEGKFHDIKPCRYDYKDLFLVIYRE